MIQIKSDIDNLKGDITIEGWIDNSLLFDFKPENIGSQNQWKLLVDACCSVGRSNYHWCLQSNFCEIDISDKYTVFICRNKKGDCELNIKVPKQNCIQAFSDIYEFLVAQKINNW